MNFQEQRKSQRSNPRVCDDIPEAVDVGDIDVLYGIAAALDL